MPRGLPAAAGWAAYWSIIAGGGAGATATLFGLETANTAAEAMLAAGGAGLWLGIAAVPWCRRRAQLDVAVAAASAAAAIMAGSLGVTLLRDELALPAVGATPAPGVLAMTAALLVFAAALRVAPAMLAERLAPSRSRQ